MWFIFLRETSIFWIFKIKIIFIKYCPAFSLLITALSALFFSLVVLVHVIFLYVQNKFSSTSFTFYHMLYTDWNKSYFPLLLTSENNCLRRKLQINYLKNSLSNDSSFVLDLPALRQPPPHHLKSRSFQQPCHCYTCLQPLPESLVWWSYQEWNTVVPSLYLPLKVSLDTSRLIPLYLHFKF